MENTKKYPAIMLFLTLGLITALVWLPGIINATGPSGNPPTANISPTFSGLTVTTDPTNIKALNVTGSISNSTGNVTIADNLYVSGPIIDYNSNLELNDTVDILNTLNVNQYLNATYDITGNQDIIAGQSLIATGNDVEVGDDLYLNGATSGIISSTDGDVNIFDGLTANGDIRVQGTSQQIGSFYTHWHTYTISGTMPDENGFRVQCATNDYIVGCSAAQIFLEPSDSGDRYMGTKILDDRTCSGRAGDGGSSNDDYLEVAARCFDPQGATTGRIELSAASPYVLD
ncbi:hypothetical protein JW911_03850 [Candidatus Peregrinibacteria bacterium]|nr:hypothetical protein [Candidatus Peregrinibacteria bacterium]